MGCRISGRPPCPLPKKRTKEKRLEREIPLLGKPSCLVCQMEVSNPSLFKKGPTVTGGGGKKKTSPPPTRRKKKKHLSGGCVCVCVEPSPLSNGKMFPQRCRNSQPKRIWKEKASDFTTFERGKKKKNSNFLKEDEEVFPEIIYAYALGF
jgi:hypothetical protein